MGEFKNASACGEPCANFGLFFISVCFIMCPKRFTVALGLHTKNFLLACCYFPTFAVL